MGPISYFKDLNERNLFEKYYENNPIQKQIDSKIDESFSIFEQDKGPQIRNENIMNQNSSPYKENPISFDFGSNLNSNESNNEKGSFLESILGKKAEGEGAFQQIAGDAIGFGKGILSQASTESSTGAEGISRGLETTFSGAKLGMSVGGPLGAGIGAAAGAVYSAIDFFNDKEKQTDRRSEKLREEDRMKKEKTDRDYLLDKGEAQIKKLQNLRSSQLNYINLNNY